MYVFIKPTLLLYVVMHDPFHFLQDHEKNIMVKIHYVLVWYTNTSTTTMSKDVNKKSRECVSERDHTVNPFSPLLGFFKTKKPQRFTKKKGISIELQQNIQTEIVTAVMCHEVADAEALRIKWPVEREASNSHLHSYLTNPHTIHNPTFRSSSFWYSFSCTKKLDHDEWITDYVKVYIELS